MIMSHKHRRNHTIARIQKKFKGLAAAVAGAAILSGGMLPGMPAATVHASADPGAAGNAPVEVSQQVKDTPSTHNSTSEKSTPSDQSRHQDSKDTNDQSKAPSGKTPTHYEKVLDIKATAYAPGAHDNDQWGDKTFLGTDIRPGVIAVDPNVIPLGSKVFIQYPDGHGEYAVAEDTGGAIKGNRIDVAKTSVDHALDFGKKDVKVFIVDSGKA